MRTLGWRPTSGRGRRKGPDAHGAVPGGVMRVARGDERGAIAVITALLSVVMFGMAAMAVDVASWYVEGQKLQRAADAAALAGVPYMPNDLDSARSQARTLVSRNGYNGAGVPDTDIVAGTRPSQLQVTLRQTVTTTFGSVLGIRTKAIVRTATADYTGPAPMGSPCNTFGNEPKGSSAASGVGPVNSSLPSDGYATCTSYPQYWSTVVGPRVYKTQGDRFGTRVCEGGESGCTGTTNNEFNPNGYVMIVRVQPEAVGKQMTVQLYDPAYIDTDSRCASLPTGIPNNANAYTNDAVKRYQNDPNPPSGETVSFCTGDNDNRSLSLAPNGSELANDSGEVPTITSFGLIQPTDTYNPFDPTANTVANRICSAQFPGYSMWTGGANDVWKDGSGTNAPGGSTTGNQLRANSDLTRLLHQWVNFCTFTPSVAGDYYLRVRTNVPMGADMFLSGDSTSVLGNGSNRFAVRVIKPAASTLDLTKVSVAAWERMPIFANSNGSSAVFNLLRVTPGSAGQSLIFSFYDVGDAGGGSGATVSILRPTDASGSQLSGCTGTGKVNGSLANCRVTGVLNSAGWNGQAQEIRVPIPLDYGCAVDNLAGCWFRLQVQFGGSVNVTDQTTWTAYLDGDPVRLVR